MPGETLHLMSPSHVKMHMGDVAPDEEMKIKTQAFRFAFYNMCTYQKLDGKDRADFKLAKGSHFNVDPAQNVTIAKIGDDPEVDKSVDKMHRACDDAENENSAERYKRKIMFTAQNSDTDPHKKDMFHISYDGFIHSEQEKTTDSGKEHIFQLILHDNESFKIH